ncbi:hypothetical protein ASU35_07790 [Acetivibrio ethanolgignens]|uniref:Uncharacterized protein n=1 Tax=Acetivibrio ethanolgignens TaxID=290052 RepID=A0A0V8QGM9_9FIRM|nr:hypothetical protein ASU35_07790 [Acetivibrio ethanolgignens]
MKIKLKKGAWRLCLSRTIGKWVKVPYGPAAVRKELIARMPLTFCWEGRALGENVQVRRPAFLGGITGRYEDSRCSRYPFGKRSLIYYAV